MGGRAASLARVSGAAAAASCPQESEIWPPPPPPSLLAPHSLRSTLLCSMNRVRVTTVRASARALVPTSSLLTTSAATRFSSRFTTLIITNPGVQAE